VTGGVEPCGDVGAGDCVCPCWPPCAEGCALCSACAAGVTLCTFAPGADDWPCGALPEGAMVAPLVDEGGALVVGGVLPDGAGETGVLGVVVPGCWADAGHAIDDRHRNATISSARNASFLCRVNMT
jgi:hypothetical protein